jgi:heat shock protein HtpX
MLSDMFSRFMFYRGSRNNNSKENGRNSLLMLIGLLFLVLSPIFGKLMQLAISRKREFLADATSVEFTRNPEGLISALKKISGDSSELKTATNATSHMYIVNPLKGKKKSSNLS